MNICILSFVYIVVCPILERWEKMMGIILTSLIVEMTIIIDKLCNFIYNFN